MLRDTSALSNTLYAEGVAIKKKIYESLRIAFRFGEAIFFEMGFRKNYLKENSYGVKEDFHDKGEKTSRMPTCFAGKPRKKQQKGECCGHPPFLLQIYKLFLPFSNDLLTLVNVRWNVKSGSAQF